MKLQKKTVENCEIVLKDKEVNFLGPQLEMKNCNVISEATSKALSFSDVSIESSIFISKVVLSNFQWCKVKLDNVKFIGQYSGCDFGSWSEFHGEYGGISNCDFTESQLSNCRFLNCDMNSISLPKWPFFTILNPIENATLIRNISWPGKLSLIMEIFSKSPEGCVAVTGNATELVNRLGGTEEEFKHALTKLKDIVL